MAELLVPQERSVEIAADVSDVIEFDQLLINTHDVEGIIGYKVGLVLGLYLGLPEVVNVAREYTNKNIIYDHQKAGNDIPAMGTEFAKVCRLSRVDAVILFPFGGKATQEAWIKAAQDNGLHVLVGGHMTQPNFLASEEGYVADDAPDRIYRLGAELGVRDFVVPGNKLEYVVHYKELLEEILGEGNFDLHAPGFITQGGELSEFAKQAGRRYHGIVGSAIYKAADQNAAAKLMTSQLKTA